VYNVGIIVNNSQFWKLEFCFKHQQHVTRLCGFLTGGEKLKKERKKDEHSTVQLGIRNE
jgi:hypothetical protein